MLNLYRNILWAALAVMVIGAWLLWPSAPAIEQISAAPAQRQSDGSLIAERRPLPSSEAGSPPHALPGAAVEERRVTIKAQPRQHGAHINGGRQLVRRLGSIESDIKMADCDPVTVNLSMIRDEEGRRVVASSPDGDILSAVDMPIEALPIPPPTHRWAAGISADAHGRVPGLWLERDLGRLRLGAELAEGQGLRVRAGWAW